MAAEEAPMRMTRPIATLVVLILFIFVVAPSVAGRSGEAKAKKDARVLRMHENLPRDPLMVLGVWLDDPGGEFHRLIDAVGRFVPGPVDPDSAAALASMDQAWAQALRTELLPCIGPELTIAVDFPPIDEAVSALQFSEGEALATLLGRVGLLAGVKDATGLDRSLRRLILASGGEIVETDALTEAVLPVGIVAADGSTPGPPRLQIFYAVRADRWALGFSAAWVRAALEPRPKGERLTDGEDFRKVLARLDPRPSDLAYVNLPKLRAYVNGSQVMRMVLQSNADVREFVHRFFTSEMMGVGLGSTSVALPDGVRTTNFGPPWLSGTAVSSGFMAALALPNLLAAVDRGKTRRTLSDIEAIAEACEGFSSDARSYPGPTDGWVPVERIATYLEPVYIGQLPRTDGWENPILYWSNGGSYRIISMGRDGRIDRDWTVQVDPLPSPGQDADIVFGDGQLLAWPSGLDSD
jgi:hypothetical protein